MGDPRLLCAKVSFTVLAILFFVLFTIYSIYVYCIDEDWWLNTHKKFHMDTDGRYPSISICISDDGPEGFVKLFNIDYRSENVDENVKENETKITYKEFLQGTCLNGKKSCLWDESLSEVEYDQATVPIEDYILGFSLFLINGSKYWSFQAPSSNSSKSFSIFSSPLNIYTSTREANQKCLTTDIPYLQNHQIYSFGILLNLSLFGEDGVRPNTGGFGIQLHYPKQILVAKAKKSRWSTFPLNDRCSSSTETTNCLNKSTMHFDVANVKAVSRRNRKKKKCIKDWENYDTSVHSMLADMLQCNPSHWNVSNNLFSCKKMKDLKHANMYRDLYKMPENISPPCQNIKNVIYQQEDYIGLTSFSSLRYPQIDVLFNETADLIDNGNNFELLFEFQVSSININFYL